MTSLTTIDPKAAVHSAEKIGRSAVSEEHGNDQALTPQLRSLSQQIRRQKPIMKAKSVSYGSSRKRISFEDRTYRILSLYAVQPGITARAAWKNLRLGSEKTFYYYIRSLRTLGYLQKGGYGFEVTHEGRKWLTHYVKRIPTLGLDIRCHELLLISPIPKNVTIKQEIRRDWNDGDARLLLTAGAKRRKLTLNILQNKPGLDYNGLSLAISLARKRAGDILNWSPRVEELTVTNFQLNGDYGNLRIEGANSISLKNFLGTVSRVYNKGDLLRTESQGGGMSIPLAVALEFLSDPESWIQGIKIAEFEDEKKMMWRAIEKIQGELILNHVKQSSES